MDILTGSRGHNVHLVFAGFSRPDILTGLENRWNHWLFIRVDILTGLMFSDIVSFSTPPMSAFGTLPRPLSVTFVGKVFKILDKHVVHLGAVAATHPLAGFRIPRVP